MLRHSRCTRSSSLDSFFTATLWLIACPAIARAGAAESGRGSPAPGVTSAVHQILIRGFKYQPDALTVKAGDTVEWKSADIVPHTATAANKSFDSGSIRPGASWKFVPRAPGTFHYTCTFHPNMKATLTVQ